MCRWIGTIDVVELTLPLHWAFGFNRSGASNDRNNVEEDSLDYYRT